MKNMILKLKKQKDYELIDSGNGEKLERYGRYIFNRPDPEALWNKKLSEEKWEEADFKFVRSGTKTKWISKPGVSNSWNIVFGDFSFLIRPTPFKHTGLFPEQILNWEWMEKVIKNKQKSFGKEPVKVLNLFAYTGGATLACAKAGAEVCHVDSSKTAVAWARENASLSSLSDKPIRWIVEDALIFLRREIKRGNSYDAIIMDPPFFGRGPKGELWKIEESFIELMKLCKEILSDKPLFILINGYSAGYSSITYENNIKDLMEGHKGQIESGELAIEEGNGDRLLPCGIFARWERN